MNKEKMKSFVSLKDLRYTLYLICFDWLVYLISKMIYVMTNEYVLLLFGAFLVYLILMMIYLLFLLKNRSFVTKRDLKNINLVFIIVLLLMYLLNQFSMGFSTYDLGMFLLNVIVIIVNCVIMIKRSL